MLKSRPGRNRHTAIYKIAIYDLYNKFKDFREKEGRYVFQIPYHLKDAAALFVQWPTVVEPEQIVLDLRD